MNNIFFKNGNTSKKHKSPNPKFSSSVLCRNNKISKRKFTLSSSKRRTKLIYYPTLNLSKKLIKNNRKKFSKKHKRNTTPFHIRYFVSLQNKNFSKLKSLSQSIFQFYSIDEDLTSCHYSVGNLIELSYMGLNKIFLISTFENSDAERILFCSNRRDHRFLKFFEETSQLINKKFRENLFISESNEYDICNLELNVSSYLQILEEFRQSVKISERDFELLKKLLIIEVPIKILQETEYDSIPRLNLNCIELKNNYDSMKEKSVGCNPCVKESKIFFFANNYEIEKKKNFLLNSIIKNSNLDYSIGNLENSGDVNVIYGVAKTSSEILCKFEATCFDNGVGNLIYKAQTKFKPIGINIGTAKNISNDNVENVYLSLESELLIKFLKNVLMRFCSEEIVL